MGTTRGPKPTRNRKFTMSATFRPRIPSKKKKTTPKYTRKIPRIIESSVGVIAQKKEILKRYPVKEDEKFPYFPDLFAAGVISDSGHNSNRDTYHHHESKRNYNQPHENEKYVTGRNLFADYDEEEANHSRQHGRGSNSRDKADQRGKQLEFNRHNQNDYSSEKQQFNYYDEKEYLSRRGGASDNLETEFVSPRSSYGEDSLTAST